MHNTQQTQQTDIRALGVIRNRDPSNLAPADLRHKPIIIYSNTRTCYSSF